MVPSIIPFPYLTKPWFCSGISPSPTKPVPQGSLTPPPAPELGLIGQRDITFCPSRDWFRKGHVTKFRLMKYEGKYVGGQPRKSFLFPKRKPQGRKASVSSSRGCSASMTCLGTIAAVCYLTNEENQHWGIRAEMGRTWVLRHRWAFLSLDFLLWKVSFLFFLLFKRFLFFATESSHLTIFIQSIF